jgi:hypothetical protein
MNISGIKQLIELLEKEVNYGKPYPSEVSKIKFRNIMQISSPHLKEHDVFLNEAYGNTAPKSSIIESLRYLKTLLTMEEESRKESERIFDNAKEKLKQAGIAFKNNDMSGVSNKLNTSVELALKDLLGIPTTIKEINVSKIIDIMINEKIGPTLYLSEVKKYVLMDNLVKHIGLSPPEQRAVLAIAATENLLRKLDGVPPVLSEEVKNKIYSGLK